LEKINEIKRTLFTFAHLSTFFTKQTEFFFHFRKISQKVHKEIIGNPLLKTQDQIDWGQLLTLITLYSKKKLKISTTKKIKIK